MDEQDLTKISDIFKSLKEFKRSVLEFYETAANMRPEDKSFWLSLADDDKKHLQAIDEMESLIKNNSLDFEIGEPFRFDLSSAAAAEIRSNIEMLKNDTLSKRDVFVAARNIEQSTVGTKYSEIVRTNNSEYIELAKEVISETVMHKGKLNKKINDLDKGIVEEKSKADKPKFIVPEIAAEPAKKTKIPELASENLVRINRYHNQFMEYLGFIGKIEGELGKHSVWMHLEKIENFMKRDMAEHFAFEEEKVFTEILSSSQDAETQNLVNEMTQEHKALLNMMGEFEKLIYGEIFPLPKAKVEQIEKLFKNLAIASLKHLEREEDKIMPLIK
jgi:hypothetical protein